jgi:RND family efflux transporter MFP subunit
MPEKNSRATLVAAALVVIAAAAGTLTLFIRQRAAQARQVELLQHDLAQGPLVRVAEVQVASADRVVSLPAEVRAEKHAVLYAKVSGYVKRIDVDRGDRVRAGQELAVLESPDLDEQVAAAQADLVFRRQQLERIVKLAPSGRASRQDLEGAESAVKVAAAALARSRVQKSYQVLRAPFDGVITARYADPGALLPAATGSTSSAQPLLEVAQLDRLRVALQLAQDDAARVRVGDPVTLKIAAEDPPVQARISRMSHSLDPRTRTMLCEIDLLRPPEGLYPGAFVNASIALHGQRRPLVPTDALVGKAGQIYVPTVRDGHVHLRQVRLGVDDGANVEVLDGLSGGEVVALNLPTDLADGAAVRVQQGR